MAFLILGHPRCGTGFMAKLFREMGYDVGHETIGKDGTSCWVYAIKDEVCFSWLKPRNAYHFDVLIHCVRDPWDALPSIAFTETCNSVNPPEDRGGKNVWLSTQFRRKYVDFPSDLPLAEQAARSYLGWNRIIELQNPLVVIRIEHPLEDLDKHAISSYDFSHTSISPVNVRKHREFTKDEWGKLCPSILKLLDEFCEQYGYPRVSERMKSL